MVRRMPKCRLAFALAGLCLLAHAANAQAPSAAGVAKSLDPFFDALERNGRMHGSVAVMRDGRLLYRRAVGMRTEANGSPLKAGPGTMYRTGSITKVFTAVLIYQLIDEQKLSLETKLSAFFPSMPNAGRITIAHLLSHSSGLGNYPAPEALADRASWVYRPQSKEEMLVRLASLKPEYEPGEKSTYSNTNFALLGYIVEQVTRSTYAAQLERRITRPLGLKRTRFGGPIDAARNEAHSFSHDDGRWTRQPEEHASVAAGAGGVTSTPGDLAKFMTALFTNRLTTAGRVTDMLTPFSDRLPGSEKGIVVFRLNDRNRPAWQHLGGIDAFQSSLTWLPDEKTAIAIAFNGQNYPMGRVFYAIVDALAARPVQVPSFAAIELGAEALARFEGVYAFPEIGMNLTIRRDAKQLSAQASGQDAFPLHAISDTTFSHPPSGILIEFRRNAGEEAYSHLVLYQGRSQMRFKRQPAPVP
jgi:D-alanyl-D-alanine carboxypeptidase